MIDHLIELTETGIDSSAYIILIALKKSNTNMDPFLIDWIIHGIFEHVHANPQKCHYFFKEMNKLNDLKNENLIAMANVA